MVRGECAMTYRSPKRSLRQRLQDAIYAFWQEWHA